MKDDLEVLPKGENTQIGDNGINLSGGQKLRVALARALYQDRDVFLFDDPLSALDAHVGKFIYHETIRKYLAGKTRVLVTHALHTLKYLDEIFIVKDGEITARGTYEEIKDLQEMTF